MFLSTGRRLRQKFVRSIKRRLIRTRSREMVLMPLWLEALENRVLLTTNTWISSAGGSWQTASDWSLGHTPTNGEDVVIPQLSGTQTITYSSGTSTIQSLTTSDSVDLSGGTLDVTGSIESLGGQFTLQGATLGGATIDADTTLVGEGGTLDGVTVNGNLAVTGNNGVTVQDGLTLNGTLSLGDSSSVGYLNFSGSQTLGGTGTVVFGSTTYSPSYTYYNGLFVTTSGTTLTIGPNVTVDGKSGAIGYENVQGSSGSSVVNQGTIEWANGGSILIPGTLTNSGTIAIDGTSTMATGGTIIGGLITTQNGAGITNVTLEGVMISGNVNISSELTVEDGLTLDGTATIAAGDSGLYFVGSQALGGSGTVVLGDEASPYYTYYNYIYTDAAASTLTIDSGITIQGKYGVLGGYYMSYYSYTASGGPIVNQGTIAADVSGGTVTLMGTGWQNTGTLEATTGGTLSLLGSALDTGEVQVNTGGLLTGTLVGATLVGSTTISGELTVEDGLTLDGTISIADGESGLYFVGTQTLDGSGTIDFGDEASPYYTYYNSIYTDAEASTLTIDSGMTIQGKYGVLGGYYMSYYGYTASGGPIVNQGTIAADVSGGTVTLMGTGWQNTGTLEATDGGTLNLLGSALDTGEVQVNTGGLLTGTLVGATLVGSTTISGELTVEDGLTLDGTISIADGESGLYFVGSQSLGGSGTIVFGDEVSPYYTYYNYIYTDAAASTLTIESGITIQGEYGVLGGYYMSYYGYTASGGPIVNQGTIAADVSGGTVTLMGTGWQNTGTLEATTGGTLSLLGSNWSSAGINSAEGGSTLSLAGTDANANQTLALSGSGSLQASGLIINGGTLSISSGNALVYSSGTLDGVEVEGNLSISGQLTVEDGLTLDGTVTIADGESGLYFVGTQALGGSATIVFGDEASPYYTYYNSIYTDAAASTLTIDSGITIQGKYGVLGGYYMSYYGYTASGGPIVNQGTIAADVSGGTVTLMGTGWQNAGTLEATDGGTLNLFGSALDTGEVQVNTGGLLTGTLVGATLVGSTTISGQLTVEDGLTLDGTISIADGESGLYFVGSQSLGGSGTIVFGDEASPYYTYYNSIYTDAAASTLTIDSGITIQGKYGVLGGYYMSYYGYTVSGGPIVNQGTIAADVSGGTVTLMGTGWQSTGTLEATTGSTLSLTGTDANANQTLALSGSGSLQASGLIINGGTLSISSGNALVYSSGILDGVEVEGNLSISGQLTVEDGLTLDGTVTFADGESGLYFVGTQALGGSGTIVFGDEASPYYTYYNYIYTDAAASTLTIDSGMTIQGKYGVLGGYYMSYYGYTASGGPIVNQGTIAADVSGGTVTLMGTGWQNTGTLEATDGGTLNLFGSALDTGEVQVNTGGLLTGTLVGATLVGSTTISGQLTVEDGLTLDGTISIADGESGLYFVGSQSLGGSGTIVFGDEASPYYTYYNYIYTDAEASTLTIDSGITIGGKYGVIGGYYMSYYGYIASGGPIVNQGTIVADVAGGALSILSQNGVFANSGTIDASIGAVSISTGSFGTVNSGTLAAGPTGSIAVTGPFTQTTTGNFDVVLGGATTGLYGQAAISGTASLNGSLNITEANGFSPGTGNNFTILTDTSSTGQFANYSGLVLNASAALQPAYNPTSVTLTTVTDTTIAPDLRVSDLALSPANPQSSQSVTVNWNDINAGNGATGGSWTDHVVVTNTTTGQTIVTADVPYDAATSGAIAPNGSAAVSYTFELPDGPAGVGTLLVSVTTDYDNSIPEYYPGNVGYTNNTTTITAVSTLAAYPDLQVTGLSTSPSALESGGTVTVTWNDANTGQAPVTGSFEDYVTAVNTTTGQTVASGLVSYNEATSGAIAAGGSAAQQYTFSLPNGTPGVGQIEVTVTTNYENSIYEYNSSGTAESNNTSSITATSTLAPYPDLQVTGLSTTPSTLESGQSVTVTWDDANTGNAPVTNSFSDYVTAVNSTTGQTVASGLVPYNEATSGAIAAGGSAAQQYTFSLPDGNPGVGQIQFTVTTDYYNQVFENNGSGTGETNNTSTITETSTIAPYPDLLVSSIGFSPSSGLLSGGDLTIDWTDANDGDAPTPGGWTDEVVVVNTTTGQTLLDQDVNYDPSAPGNGDIAPNDSRELSTSLTLPQGAAGVGDLQVTITANAGDSFFEWNASGTGQTNNTSTAEITSTLAPYPDLQVTGLTVSPTSLVSGGPMVIDWNDANTGNAPVQSSFYDHVTVTNTTTGQVVGSGDVYYDATATGSGPIAAGSSAANSFDLTLPNGAPGIGVLSVTVTTDYYNQVFENNASGTAETNNSATVTTTSVAAAYPDLQVDNLAVTPSATVSGGTVEVTWDDANTGNAPVDVPFVDNLTIVNNTTGATLLSTDVAFNPSLPGNSPIAAGGSQPQSYDFTLPQGDPGVGNLTITVTTDASNQVFEYNSSGTGETNNTATQTATSTLAPYPDLAVSDVSAAAAVAPGQTVNVGWTLTNSGNASASAPWTEQVFLATDAAGDDPTLVLAQTDSDSLGAGQSVSRSADVTIPSLPAGTYWFEVIENPFGEVFEVNTANNTAVAAQSTSVAGTLTLSLASQTVSNAAGSDATTATVTRNTNTTNALQVTITNSDTYDVTVPQTVTIPAGATSVTFAVGTINNNVVEGTQTATLTASASGQVSGSDTLTVTDVNVPTLTLVLNTHTVNETDTNPAAYGTITRNTPTSDALIVSLLSDEANKLTVPATLTIPAGATSATFPVTVVNDQQIDGNATTTITASAAGFVTGSDSAEVIDDNIPTLSLTLADQTVSEAAGADATTGTVSIAAPDAAPVIVTLTSSDITAATVPTEVIIAAGQLSATFPVSAIDDGLDLGNKTAIITAEVTTISGTVLTQGEASDSLTLVEHDGPALSLAFPVAAIAQDGITTAIVSRNTPTTEALVVTLTSSDTTQATVPPSVTIPAGQFSTTFTITGVNDGLEQGEQYFQITASATGLEPAIAAIGVTSVNLPDLTVASVTAPPSGYAGSTIAVSWTVLNNGLFAADGTWIDELYLVPLDGATGGGLVDTVEFSGEVDAGATYTQTDTITLPTSVGQYDVQVVADADQQLQELSFSNNTGTSAQAVDDQAPYDATVSTTIVAPVSSGTPIPLAGQAISNATGEPVANVPVSVDILVDGTQRVLTATTDDQGDYAITFQPLPDETGDYSIAAGYSGSPTGASQGQFTIVGITANPANISTLQLVPGIALTGQITLINLNDTPLTGITATVQGGPSGLTTQLTASQTLAASGQETLSYSLTASDTGGARQGAIVIEVSTDQGAVVDIPIDVSVVPLTPELIADPSYLDMGMVVGTQTQVSFQVTNDGGASSDNLQVELPAAPWLSLASTAEIPSLAPGASTTVTLQLTPASSLALSQYNGSIVIGSDAANLSVPFTFRAITTAVGDVQVLVDDDYTFTETGSPRVAGATVNLLDPYDYSQVIATGTTDSTGQVTLPNVPGGAYVLQVQAAGHDSYEVSYTVTPGITNTDEAFLSNNLVTYSWEVTPTTIADQYSVQLETTFQTDVPAPVLTISTASDLPTLQPGQSGELDVTLTNHGLIAAEDVSFQLPTDPDYTFTALSTDIGNVPADSTEIVPVIVYRELNAQPSVASGSPACTLDIPAVYYFTCAGVRHELTAATTVHVPGRICDDIAGIITDFSNLFPPIPIPLPHLGTGGGGTTPTQPGDGTTTPTNHGPPGPPEPITYVPPPIIESPVNCDACLSELGADLADYYIKNNPGVKVINALISANNAINAAENFLNSPNVQGDPMGLNGAVLGLQKASSELPVNKIKDTFDQLKGIKDGLDNLNTIIGLVKTCINDITGQSLGSGTVMAAGGGDPTLDAALATLEQEQSRLQAVVAAYTNYFGSSDWLSTSQTTTLGQWLSDFVDDTAANSDGGDSITDAERATLLATTLPDTVTVADANEFIDRWNLTLTYYAQGIITASQVPAGQSTDFMDVDQLASLFGAANQAVLASEADGYTDPLDESLGVAQQLITMINDDSVCATIQLQIDQTVALTRTAFSGTLTLSDQMSDDSLQDIELDLTVTDANGNPVNGLFYISSPTLSGALTAVDGTGILPADSTGSVTYTFIPSEDAALTSPTVYYIGGTLKYVDPDMGGEVVTPIYSSAITVDPQANLQLNYFLQQDVIGDDPSTPQVEPSEPAVLGVLVTNVGGGTASSLSITTAQPQIVQNDKGLLDTFQIIGTQVGTQQETPSLTVDFGDLAPGQTGDADFLLLSALQGQFEDFSATFTHSDSLGGTETSLISSVQTHDLIHAGDFNDTGTTGEMDYLVDDVPNLNSLPDTIYFSDGTTAPVNDATDGASNPVGPSGDLTFQVTANVTSGWDYIQIPDPGAGYTLYKVVRSDGAVIPVSDQAWTTDRTIDPTGKSTVDYELHILDDNSTGSYMVYYRPANATAPAISSVSSVSSPQSGAIASLDVTFSESIDPSTFTAQNLTLTLNGGSNLINSAVTITQDSPTTFTIGGLAGLTAGDGNYLLTVSAMGVSDFFGDVGSGSQSTSWATGTDVPVVVSVGATNPTLRNTPVQTVDVVLAEPIDPASFDDQALSLTLNNGPNLITPDVTVTQIDATTYRIGGLAPLTAVDGDYTLTVSAAGFVDGSGNSGVGSLSETWTMNTVGPTIVSLPNDIQSPRNIVVPSIDVIFSEPIDPTTFTYQNITYSKTGGANLITSAVTITELSPTEFEISNFNNLVAPIDGTYTFTVSAVGVQDLAGNVGSGTVSDTWVLQTSGPATPTDLAISPDNGVSSTDGLTDTGSVTLTGTLSETGLSVDIFDASTGVDLGYATVDGTSFSAALNLPAGSNELQVTAMDSAGNVSQAGDFTAFIDLTAPAISSIDVISPNPRKTTVDTIDVTFTKPINLATFTTADLSLTDNGGANLITSDVTISLVSGSTYRINSLSGLTVAEGNYTLTVDASGIQDLAGNAGTNSLSTTWLMDTTPPTSTVAPLPQTTTTTSFTITVNGTDPSGSNGSPPSGIASFAIYTSTDNGPFTFWTTVTPSNPSAVFTGQFGHTYGFFSVATDNAGNVQATPTAAQATIQVIPPVKVSSITAVSPNPRNTLVSDVSVSFSAAIGTSVLTSAALSLTDNGGPNLITGSVPLTHITADTYDISDLSALTQAEGNYTLTIDAAGLEDQYGNAGTGSMSTSWLMDTTPPTSTVNPLPAATTSTSFTVSVTGSDPSGANDSPPSGVADYAIYDSEDNGPFTRWMTVTPASPSATFTGQMGHTYGFYSVATDNAGNVQPTPLSAQQTVQILPPMTVTSITAVSPNPRTTPVSSVDVTFSLPINTSSLMTGALTLTDNGSPVNLSGVSLLLEPGTTTTYAIGNLSGLTASAGAYTLSVNPTDILDQYGNPGTGSPVSTSWLLTGITTPTITWSNPANLVYGTALSASQLDASANVSGKFTYTPSLGTVLHAGNDQTLSVTFTPDDTTDYTTASATVTINVLQATPTITWTNPAAIVYGTPLSATQLDATSSWTVGGVNGSVAGTFTYSPSAGTLLNAVNGQTLSVSFMPTDSTDYANATATTSLNVLPATPRFSGLTPSQAIFSGIGSISLGGTISTNTSVIPPGTVAITIDGATQTANVQTNGSFIAIFNTQAIPVSTTSYTITYAYAGGGNFQSASDASTSLTVIAATIAAVSPNPRNTPVSVIDITLTDSIITTDLTSADLSLTDNGVSSLITGPVSLTHMTGNAYQIGSLSGLTAAQGLYSLTLNAAGLQDQAGHTITGSLSTTWLMDTTPPASTVSPLPKVGTSLSFPVTVTGTVPTEPAGSPTVNITSFAVYVSTNGGAWTLWQTLTPSSATPNTASATFTGASNTAYSFYTVATDNADNTQAYKPTVEASTDLPNLNTPMTQVASSSSYNTANDTFTLNLTGTDTGGSGLAYFEVFAAVDAGNFSEVGMAIPAGVASSNGTYQATIAYPGLTDGVSHTYRFFSVGIDAAGLVQPSPSMPNVTDVNVMFQTPSQFAVTGLTVENGAAERSYIRYLDLNFNESNSSVLQSIVNSVNDPTDYGPSELALTQYGLDSSGAGTPVSLKGLLDVIDSAIAIDFGAGGIGGNPGTTTADGYYTLTFTPQSGQGQAATHHFYRLLGDVNGDGTVDQNDLNAIAAARGQSLSQIATTSGQPASSLTALSMDVNGDGTVNTTDLALATKSKGRSVASNLPEG